MTSELHAPTDLPSAVGDYFAAGSGNAAALIDLFSTDAEVIDDGHTFRGRDEVLAFLNGPASAFTYTTTFLETEVNDLHALVVTRIEGNFPGGVVSLRNEFQLSNAGQISSLHISAE